MEFTIITPAQVDRLCEITDQAKRQLRGLGIDQWQKGYPSRETWEQDVRDACAYLALENGKVIGAFALKADAELSYAQIEGRWLTDGPYASVHRLCVADGEKGKGVAGRMLAFAGEAAVASGLTSVRIDTHPGNTPMRRTLEKAGFEYCGIIRLAEGCERGDMRVAFEKARAEV